MLYVALIVILSITNPANAQCPIDTFACPNIPICFFVVSSSNLMAVKSTMCPMHTPGATIAVLNTKEKMEDCLIPNLKQIDPTGGVSSGLVLGLQCFISSWTWSDGTQLSTGYRYNEIPPCGPLDLNPCGVVLQSGSKISLANGNCKSKSLLYGLCESPFIVTTTGKPIETTTVVVPEIKMNTLMTGNAWIHYPTFPFDGMTIPRRSHPLDEFTSNPRNEISMEDTTQNSRSTGKISDTTGQYYSSMSNAMETTWQFDNTKPNTSDTTRQYDGSMSNTSETTQQYDGSMSNTSETMSQYNESTMSNTSDSAMQGYTKQFGMDLTTNLSGTPSGDQVSLNSSFMVTGDGNNEALKSSIPPQSSPQETSYPMSTPLQSTELVDRSTIPTSGSTSDTAVDETMTSTHHFFPFTIYDRDRGKLTQATAEARCPIPPRAANTAMDLSHDVRGSVATYSCWPGFRFPSGEVARTAICKNGTWNIKVPGCKEMICESNSNLNKVRVANPSPAALEESKSMCFTGELLDSGLSMEILKCIFAGNTSYFHQAESDCAANRCLAPPVTVNSTLDLFDQSQRIVRMACFLGHRFPDGLAKHYFYCNADGTWNYIPPCELLICPKLVEERNITISYNHGDGLPSYGVVATVSCNEGFWFPLGMTTFTIECLENGTWDDTLSYCDPIICTQLPQVWNATLTGNGGMQPGDVLPYGTVISVTCSGEQARFEDGRETKSVACSRPDTWNDSYLSCDINRCPPVPMTLNGQPNSSLALKGSIVQYFCDLGYTFSRSSSESIYCDGKSWLGDVPQCQVVTCPELNVSYATANSSDNIYQSSVNISCDEGFAFGDDHQSADSVVTSVVVYCTSSGTWSIEEGLLNCRARDCGPPPIMEDVLTSIPRSFTFSQTVTYGCFHGFWFARDVYSVSTRCQANGQWSQRTSTDGRQEITTSCTPVACAPLTPRLLNTSTVIHGTAVNVSCPNGQWLKRDGEEGGLRTMVTVCGDSGQWYPPVPHCTDQQQYRPLLPVSESTGAKYMGAIAILFVVCVVVYVIIVDRQKIVKSLSFLKGNIKSMSQ